MRVAGHPALFQPWPSKARMLRQSVVWTSPDPTGTFKKSRPRVRTVYANHDTIGLPAFSFTITPVSL